MELISNYGSNLSTFQYLQLIALLQSNVTQGEYAAGSLFDLTAAQALQTAAQDFASLPIPAAGQKAQADSLNYPLTLLQSRYTAIANERQDFVNRLAKYMSVLEKDGTLIDFLISAARLRYWVAQQPQLTEAAQFSWDFAAAPGPRGLLPLTDPVNPALLHPEASAVLPAVSLLLNPNLPVVEGLGAPATVTVSAPLNCAWSSDSAAESETLYGDDWAKLSILEDAPLVVVGASAVMQVLPQATDNSMDWSQYFIISGQSNPGNLPVFVETALLPRRNSLTLTIDAALTPIVLTPYQTLLDDLVVVDDTQSYQVGAAGTVAGLDFSVDTSGRVMPLTPSLAGVTVTLLFTEYYPAFRCSLNQGTWSQYVMLDPAQPYPDSVTEYAPIQIQGKSFAITDETGSPTGLWIALRTPPTTGYLLRLEPQVSSNCGETATLELDFKGGYMTGLRLAPFSSYPAYVQNIALETPGGPSLFEGKFLLDRSMTFHFPQRTLAKRLYVTVYQENYTLNQHPIDPADRAKRSMLAVLQAVLPFNVQSIAAPSARLLTGAQYDFAVRDIAAIDSQTLVTANGPGLRISGPYDLTGTPEILRFDATLNGSVSTYLLYQETYGDGSTSAIAEDALVSTNCFPYTPLGTAPVSVRFWVKFVLRDSLAVIQRFLLQVTTA